jgi:hypothetical protein
VTGTQNEDPNFIPASRKKVPAWRTQSVCLEHPVATFPLSYIKVHPQMASEKEYKVVYFVTTKTLN